MPERRRCEVRELGRIGYAEALVLQQQLAEERKRGEGVDRLLLALSPKRRQRRAERGAAFTWQFGRLSSGTIIDATATEATVVDTRAIGTTAETDGPPGDAGPGAPEAE